MIFVWRCSMATDVNEVEVLLDFALGFTLQSSRAPWKAGQPRYLSRAEVRVPVLAPSGDRLPLSDHSSLYRRAVDRRLKCRARESCGYAPPLSASPGRRARRRQIPIVRAPDPS